MFLLSTLAALSAAVASVNAANAYIYNNCKDDAYVSPVAVGRPSSGPFHIPAGGSWSEPYYTPTSGGVSLKMSKSASLSNPTQFEYTLTAGDYPFIWYDISNIDCIANGCPWDNDETMIEASIKTCPTRSCAAGVKTCPGYYNVWNDDTATLSCDPKADVIFHLCPNNGTSSGSAPSASSSKAAPSSSAKASSTHHVQMEAPVATTMYTTTKAAALAVRTAHPLEAHAHARRHFHQGM
jgi:hypothetical protein